MTSSRRELIKRAAFAGLFAGVSSCGGGQTPATTKKATAIGKTPTMGSSPTPPDASIAQADIAAAEKLAALSYSAPERNMMLNFIEASVDTLKKIHALEFDNSEPPALIFNPKLPRKKISSQKNRLVLAATTPPSKPNREEDIAYASVAEQGTWLRSKSITAIELTNIYLKRIEKFGAGLSALVTVTGDLAREQAAKADDELAAGKDRGPLHGIPFVLKDIVDTAGILTSWGAEPYSERIPEKDAEIVRKLRAAGAVLLGKSACGAIAYGDEWFGGVTKNPWNPDEGSSGSSAGSAAAVAAGLCSFAIGSETYGSIIAPSERCGAVGLRPTFGRVSRAGVMTLCWSLDKIGAICRSVEDSALVLSQINGYDADDPGTARFGFTYDGGADISGMTVGYVKEWFDEGDEADMAALEAARSLGVKLKPFPWPQTDFGPLLWIVFMESAAAFTNLTLSNRDDDLSWQEPEAWPNTWRSARLFPAVDYLQIDRLRQRAMVEMSAAFEGFDALIGPHYAANALLVTNCTGHPQLALRAGFAQTQARRQGDDTGARAGAATFRTPRGVSLWGDLFQEGKIIALGRAIERSLNVAHERPPGF